jgi:hypothetical protein
MADFAASAGMELFHVGKFGIFGSKTPQTSSRTLRKEFFSFILFLLLPVHGHCVLRESEIGLVFSQPLYLLIQTFVLRLTENQVGFGIRLFFPFFGFEKKRKQSLSNGISGRGRVGG